MNALTLGRRLSVLLLAGATLSGTAQAATQGSLGATSTGSIAINASVTKQVRISGLEDVSFLNADPEVDASNAQNVCVWSNGVNKRYSIVASGSGTSGAYTLAGASTTVPYAVKWHDTATTASATTLASGVARPAQNGNVNSTTCANTGENASLVVEIAAADLQTMQGGDTYTGTLSLTVSPE